MKPSPLVCLVLCSIAVWSGRVAGFDVVNERSRYAITIDGRFTGGVDALGVIQGEWSDVVPIGLTCPADPTEEPVYGPATMVGVEGLLAMASCAELPPHGLYMYFAFLPRLEPDFMPGSLFGTITVPFLVDGVRHEDFTVLMQGNAAAGLSFVYDLDGDGTEQGLAEDLGIIENAERLHSP